MLAIWHFVAVSLTKSVSEKTALTCANNVSKRLVLVSIQNSKSEMPYGGLVGMADRRNSVSKLQILEFVSILLVQARAGSNHEQNNNDDNEKTLLASSLPAQLQAAHQQLRREIV